MKKITIFLLILSCLWLCSCKGFLGTTGEGEKDSEETTEETVLDTTEDTAEETEPPIGHTVENPTPFGEYVQIPASKADLTMKVLEVLGDAENVVIKMNLTVENLKSNTRLDLSMADFELFCENGLILTQEYDYYDEYYGIDETYNLDIPNVYNLTMGTDGSVDFYVHFRGDIDNCKLLSTTYATNKYIYFSLT